MAMTPEVKVCDVTLRDGLQTLNRKAVIPIKLRLELLEALQRSRLPYLEIGSFVNRRIIPAMRDTADFIASMAPYAGQIAILVPKLSYYRALGEDRERKVNTVALFVSASELYSTTNTRMTKEQAYDSAREVAEAARADGYAVRGYLSCAFRDVGQENLPMDPEVVGRDCAALLDMGCEVVALSDTDGRATPRDIERIVRPVGSGVGLAALGVHLHDRYGQGIANALVAYQLGIRVFDSSIGGIGGTRAVKNSVGNLATEELVTLFEGLGVETGVLKEPLIDAGKIVIEMARLVGDPLPPSKLLSHRLLRKDASGFINVPAAAHIAVSTLQDRKVIRQGRNWAALAVAVARTRIGTAAIASVLTMLLVLLTGLLLTYVFSVFSIVRGDVHPTSRASSAAIACLAGGGGAP